MEGLPCATIILSALLCSMSSSLSKGNSEQAAGVSGVTSITFLVTVNDTWKWDPPIYNDTCMVTVKTNPLYPNTPRNKSENIMVGSCDNGPLMFSVNSASSVFLTFHSSVILDASPPTCTIAWSGSYLLPTRPPGSSATLESLLPGCFTADSREGYHMTNYWFYILDWSTSTQGIGVNQKWSSTTYSQKIPSAVASVTFLVAVNQTETKCLATSKTPPLKPGKVHNKTEYIYVGECDYGALDFNITTAEETSASLYLVFHSHDIEDASPPTCTIVWDYSYLVPAENNYKSSLLPGCATSESREGFHMTYYWFYILDWSYG